MSRAASLNVGDPQSLLLVEEQDWHILLLKAVLATELQGSSDLKIVQVWLLSWACAGLDVETSVQVRHHGRDSLGDVVFPHFVPF